MYHSIKQYNGEQYSKRQDNSKQHAMMKLKAQSAVFIGTSGTSNVTPYAQVQCAVVAILVVVVLGGQQCLRYYRVAYQDQKSLTQVIFTFANATDHATDLRSH